MTGDASMSSSTTTSTGLLTTLVILVSSPLHANAWGSSSSGTNRYTDERLYSQSGKVDWLYNSQSMGFQYLGCAWSYTESNEDYGCREDGSEDGTYYWYQMANCRRAQVAYNVYGSDSGTTSCASSDFKESFHSTIGLSGFAALLSSYDSNAVITYDDIGDLPACEQGDSGYYEMVGCSDSGTFQVDYFEDSYCLKSVGQSYELSTVNQLLSKMSGCHSCYDSSNGGDASSSLCGYLISYSESCSNLDNSICGDADGSKSASYNYAGEGRKMPTVLQVSSNVGNKIKYVFGSLFLISSFVMFLGILMMNRRKRRANLNRKFRQAASSSRRRRGGDGTKSSRSRSRRSGSRSEGRSGSRSRSEGGGERSSSNRRSSSRKRSSSRARATSGRGASEDDKVPADKGIYT